MARAGRSWAKPQLLTLPALACHRLVQWALSPTPPVAQAVPHESAGMEWREVHTACAVQGKARALHLSRVVQPWCHAKVPPIAAGLRAPGRSPGVNWWRIGGAFQMRVPDARRRA